ncbi:MAG: ABC transporter permease [Gemmatimonadota bacterium]|nr:ABC transporter permease [Gemmatimonadota bacterium]
MTLLLRFLLRTYPRSFRTRFGPELVGQAEDDVARAFERGPVAGAWCALATCIDLVWSGLAERWRPVWRREGNVTSDDEMGVGTMMGQWIGDLRQAGRSLRKSPGFAFAAVATLALALGANAALFGVVDAVLLRPLPYEDSDRLVHIAASAPGSDLPDEFGVPLEFFLHYRDQATQLEDLATFNSFTATLRAGDRVERLRQSMPSRSLFSTLGVEPILGRLPVEGEDGTVALLSHELWTTWFGADPAVIGRSHYFVNGPKEIIGVMGPDFRFPVDGVAAWIPDEHAAADVPAPGRFGDFNLVGRLTDGADHASLTRELDALADRLPELWGGPPSYTRIIERHRPVVRSLRDRLLGDVTGPLWILMASVTVVLLIACANVAGLFTVRAETRGRDLAVRRAIGAGRGDLIRSQLAEAAVVAGLAGAGALALARLGLPAFRSVAPDGLPRVADVGLSPTTVLFVLGASAFAALACGLGPAVRSSAPDLDRLKDGARGSTRRRWWGRDGLVVAQTALALVLLVGSGLLLRSFQQLHSVDPGYDTEEILTFQFAPDEEHLVDGPTWARFHLDFMDRLRAMPGVEQVGIVENVPLDEGVASTRIVTERSGPDEGDAAPRIGYTFAGGDYFRAMGIEVLQGRGFVDDDAVLPGNVVVSRGAADLLWPDEDPVGRRIRTTELEEWHTVVGVVDDVHQYDFRREAEPTVYFPLIGPTPRSWALTSPGYVVRGPGAESLAPAIREAVREVAPSAPMYRVYTMRGLVDRSMIDLSFTMLILAVAAGLALTLGVIGLYGVLSYVVTQRTREIGVRMALGAEAGRVRRMVVGQGARVVALGIVLGLAVALLAVRALSSMLYGITQWDPWTFAGTALAMAAIGLTASYVPARRASRVDPIESMRGG